MSQKRRSIKYQHIIQFVLLLAIIIFANILAAIFFTRFDLTDDNRYTVSKPTIELLRSIKEPVLFKVYLDGDMPASYKHLRNETKELLQEFKAYNNKNILFEFIDPNSEPNRERRNNLHKQLLNKGLMPRNISTKDKGKVSNQVIFPGAIVTHKGKELPMAIFKNQLGKQEPEIINNSIQQLEYTIASTLKSITTDKKRSVAFTYGHGELRGIRTAWAQYALSQFYQVDFVKLDGNGHRLFNIDPKDSVTFKIKYDALIIAKPDSFFQKKDQFLLDQYIMHGGKVLWLIDPVYASLDFLQDTNAMLAYRLDLNLNEQLFHYGVKLNTDLIRDLNSIYLPLNVQPAGSQPKFDWFPWPFSPLLTPKSDHPIVKNVSDIKTEFISSIDTVELSGVKKTILLSTSKQSRRDRTPVPIDMRMMLEEQNKRLYSDAYIPVAVLLEGRFNSFFKNRFAPRDADNDLIALEESKPTKMIVVADGDVIKNQSRKDEQGQIVPLPLGFDQFSGVQFGNDDFLLNAVNYLLDDSGLLEARKKEFRMRPLDKQKINDPPTVFIYKIVNVLVPILLIVIMAIVVLFLKKRRYAL